jgi:hypothetical protein
MNILVDWLPEAVEVHGKEYAVNSDFRPALRTILAFESNQLTFEEKYAVMLQNLYPVIPDDMLGAFNVGMRFLNGGKVSDEEEDNPRLYSFEKDANLIFAAFRQTHGIDLNSVNLHWWAFLALFMDLGSETAFCQLVGLRKRVKNGTATKDERKMARDMGDSFEVPEYDDRTLEEREQEAEFMASLGGK